MFKLLKVLGFVLSLDYVMASIVVEKVLKKMNLILPQEAITLIKDKVHRLRFELRLLFRLLMFITGFYALPMQMRIWDLEWQLLIERFLNPIFEVLSFCQGLITGILIGILVTVTLFWLEKNKARILNYYLLHVHGAK